MCMCGHHGWETTYLLSPAVVFGLTENLQTPRPLWYVVARNWPLCTTEVPMWTKHACYDLHVFSCLCVCRCVYRTAVPARSPLKPDCIIDYISCCRRLADSRPNRIVLHGEVFSREEVQWMTMRRKLYIIFIRMCMR